MSYSLFTETSREIALLTLPTLLYVCQNARYRLIPNLGVYYCYDNSSALLNDKSCTLSYIDFYIFITYITAHKRQPYTSILMPDDLQDSSKPHDIVVYTWVTRSGRRERNCTVLHASSLDIFGTVLLLCLRKVKIYKINKRKR